MVISISLSNNLEALKPMSNILALIIIIIYFGGGGGGGNLHFSWYHHKELIVFDCYSVMVH